MLNPLVEHMELNGKASAPSRIVGNSPTVVDALRSYAVLQEDAGQLLFVIRAIWTTSSQIVCFAS